jgi:DNA-binding LytR/AlgR family response regulator
MLQIAICDDNRDDLSNMEQLISQYRETKNLNCEYTAFSRGIDLVSALNKGKQFDLYCLDIVMPGIMGTDVAKRIRAADQTAQIVFFSSSNEFATESYAVKAAGYVLKPVSQEKLFAAFDNLLERTLPASCSEDSRAQDEAALIVKCKEGLEKILISNLVFAETTGTITKRRVSYHLRCGTIVEGMETISWASGKLLPYGYFVQPHRSYLVNIQHVATIKNYQIILQSGSAIPISRLKTHEIKKRYLAYHMDRE